MFKQITHNIIWRKKHLIVTLSLASALIWPVGVDIIKAFIPTTQASYEKQEPLLKAELEIIIEERTLQIHNEMKDEAKIRAYKSIVDDIGLLMDEQMKKDYREALMELEN